MDLCVLLLRPSILGWKAIDNECLQSKVLIKLYQKYHATRKSQSDIIKAGIP